MSSKRQTQGRLLPYMVTILFIVVAMLCACSKKDEVAGDAYTFAGAEWRYDSPVVFNQEGDSLPGNVTATVVSLRHTNDYPYANIWLEIAYLHRDSLTADTFDMRLADSFGRWLGSGSGPVITKTDTLRLRHNPDVRSEFRLRHIMRLDKLPEVEQVSMSFVTGAAIPEETPVEQSEDPLEENND